MIKQNNWRLPGGKDKTTAAGGDEGSTGGGPAEKSDEQLSLEQEAAQAIIKGEQTLQGLQ